jgi:hypothetical protein
MKKLTIYSSLLLLFFTASLFPFNTIKVFADEKQKEKPYMKEIEKMRLKKKSGIFNLNLDVQLGLDFTTTTFELNTVDTTTNKLTSATSKVGPAAGIIFSVDFLGFGFTSGLLYAQKGFHQVDGTNFNMNFINIPLLLYFDFTISKVIIEGNIGPYFGLLMSSDNSPVYSVKKFDFGVTGNIQGAYMINNYIGPLLGVKYEYGGLNNLGSNEIIKSIRTSAFFIYTGVKFVL